MLIKRDGFFCFYCKIRLMDEYDYEHLDGNRLYSPIENIVLSHHACNIEKITNGEYQLMADEKLLQNEQMSLHYLEDDSAHEQNSSEVQINNLNYNFTEKYISERKTSDGRALMEDMLAEIPYLTQKQFHHGSEQSVRRYIKQLTCKASDWEVIKDEKGKKWIVDRKLN